MVVEPEDCEAFVKQHSLHGGADVNLKAFLWMGCISAGAGVVFLLAGLIVSWKDDR